MALPQVPCSPIPGSYKNVLDVLKEIVNDGLPVVHVFPFKMACFSYLLFDIEELFMDEESTSKELQLRMKNLGDGRFQPVMVDAECAMQWREELHVFEYTTIVAPAPVASFTITVADVTVLKGLTVNTKIRIQSTAAPFTVTSPGTVQAIVTNIAGNVLTLNVAVTANIGDRVFRGANLRHRCDPINNKFELNKQAAYRSHFQTLQIRLDFETCELSVDREVYCFKQGGSQLLVNAKMNAAFEGVLKNDFVDAFLYGENLQDIKPTQFGQTRGLLWSIQDAQAHGCGIFIYDLEACCGTTSDDGVIGALIEIFIKAFESGYYNNEPITSAINSAQLKNLMYMAPSFEEFFGVQMYRETPTSHEGCRDYVTLRVHGIEIEHGSVEFVLFEPLNYYFETTPIMILMPKSMIGFFQRKFSRIDRDLNVMETQVNQAGIPTFKFTDISTIINAESGGDECFSYIAKIEFALAMAGVYNGAYYVIKNALSFRTCNPTCVPVQDDIVIINP